jgi:hypothetical protein
MTVAKDVLLTTRANSPLFVVIKITRSGVVFNTTTVFDDCESDSPVTHLPIIKGQRDR